MAVRGLYAAVTLVVSSEASDSTGKDLNNHLQKSFSVSLFNGWLTFAS